MRLRPSLFIAVFGLACCLPSFASEKNHQWTSSFSKYVNIDGATSVGADTCSSCHSDLGKNFQHAYHKQQGVECEDCHGNGSLHVEGGGDISKIISFTKRTPQAANGVCLGCHNRDERVRHWLGGSHSANHLRCVDCHQVHEPALKAASQGQLAFDTATRAQFTAAAVSPETDVIMRPRWQSNDACLKCHQTQGGQLSMPYHHPLREAKMTCMDCHDPHGGPAGNNLRTANVNQLCLGCHAQYRGPFAYQHPPVTENCMICHTAHGSPNTNLLMVSEPALCLQCHAGHHNGAGLPLVDRCTNCHGSIHGTDVPTPSGGSRFIDKGPSEPSLVSGTATVMAAHAGSMVSPVPSHAPTFMAGAAAGAMGMMSAGMMPPLAGGNMWSGSNDPAASEMGGAASVYSITPGAYRFIDGTGYMGRVGEYDSLEESAGADAVTSFVSPQNHLTVVSRANVISQDDYYAKSQITVGQRFRGGFDMRSFVQQQDNYPFYTGLLPLSSDFAPPDGMTDLIPSHAVFGVTRRLGSAYGRLKLPKLPVHLFINGDWQARSGVTQFSYLDENTGTTAATCGVQCHHQSQFQSANYTTRNVGGGADVDLGPVRLTWQHTFSSFNDRLTLPTGVFGGFFPSVEGISAVNPPPFGPAPADVTPGNYFLDITAPSQYSSDAVSLNWTASPQLIFNGNVSYTRLRDLFTSYPQNALNSDNTLIWRPLDRLRVIASYHQQNQLNNFTPYYSMYGDVSYHEHWGDLRLNYQLPKGFDVEGHYRRSDITRSNSFLWPQVYSIDNTDLLTVVPSSFSNTAGLALRYHDRGYWTARAGYEWIGTHNPGYLLVPRSDNRVFTDVWFTPSPKISLSNDFSVIVQNAFPAVPLPTTDFSAPAAAGFGTDIAGLPPTFQRRDRFYFETLSATFRLVPEWYLGLGYSYQQDNLTTYMAFQNDSSVGYVLDEPAVPYKQIAQTYWGESNYLLKQRLGVNFRLTYNSSRSGIRPDVNPADFLLLGNQYLNASGAFNSGCASGGPCFADALNNVFLGSTLVSQVVVPEWIGLSKVYYRFPGRIEGGLIVYYGTYRDYWHPNLNGVLRTFNIYVGRSW
jgi:predicted CXXCH cytochrome family protein